MAQIRIPKTGFYSVKKPFGYQLRDFFRHLVGAFFMTTGRFAFISHWGKGLVLESLCKVCAWLFRCLIPTQEQGALQNESHRQ